MASPSHWCPYCLPWAEVRHNLSCRNRPNIRRFSLRNAIPRFSLRNATGARSPWDGIAFRQEMRAYVRERELLLWCRRWSSSLDLSINRCFCCNLFYLLGLPKFFYFYGLGHLCGLGPFLLFGFGSELFKALHVKVKVILCFNLLYMIML